MTTATWGPHARHKLSGRSPQGLRKVELAPGRCARRRLETWSVSAVTMGSRGGSHVAERGLGVCGRVRAGVCSVRKTLWTLGLA